MIKSRASFNLSTLSQISLAQNVSAQVEAHHDIKQPFLISSSKNETDHEGFTIRVGFTTSTNKRSQIYFDDLTAYINFMHQSSSFQLNAQTAKAQHQLRPITRISHLCLNFKLSGSYLLSHNDHRSDQLNGCRTYFNLGGKLFLETWRIWLVLFWKECS
jgi:hypothetical protein